MSQIQVTQHRSVIGCPGDQRRTVRSLGLHRIGDSAVHTDNPTIRGMVNKVRHLVTLEELSGDKEQS